MSEVTLSDPPALRAATLAYCTVSGLAASRILPKVITTSPYYLLPFIVAISYFTTPHHESASPIAHPSRHLGSAALSVIDSTPLKEKVEVRLWENSQRYKCQCGGGEGHSGCDVEEANAHSLDNS